MVAEDLSDRVVSFTGDAERVLQWREEKSIHCCVTSPPFFGLRTYLPDGHPDKKLEVGLEETPQDYVDRLVATFRSVRRVLRDDGTLWLNLGDSYAGGGGGNYTKGVRNNSGQNVTNVRNRKSWLSAAGVKSKDLLGIPWAVAFALRDDGWYLRAGVPWVKRNSLPESSARDRPHTSLEYVFLLTKSPTYYFDQEAVKRPTRCRRSGDWWFESVGMLLAEDGELLGFDVPQKAYKGAHFACFPPALVEPMIQAGTSEGGVCSQCGTPRKRVVERERIPTRPGTDTKTDGVSDEVKGNRDPKRHVTKTTTVGWEFGCNCEAPSIVPATVLDPFAGSGVTGAVCQRLGRRAILIDLNSEYVRLQSERVAAAG